MADVVSAFAATLEVLTGAKESIRGAADFFERHPALASALAASLLKRASVLSATPPCEARAAALLRLVYVVNDALFAAQRAAPARPVTATVLLAGAPALFFAAGGPPPLGCGDKLSQLATFWAAHALVDEGVAKALHAAASHNAAPLQASPPAQPQPQPQQQPPPPLQQQQHATPSAQQPPPEAAPRAERPRRPEPEAEPPCALGRIPELVRRANRAAGTTYAPLSRADCGAAHAPPRGPSQYILGRLEAFYAELNSGPAGAAARDRWGPVGAAGGAGGAAAAGKRRRDEGGHSTQGDTPWGGRPWGGAGAGAAPSAAAAAAGAAGAGGGGPQQHHPAPAPPLRTAADPSTGMFADGSAAHSGGGTAGLGAHEAGSGDAFEAFRKARSGSYFATIAAGWQTEKANR